MFPRPLESASSRSSPAKLVRDRRYNVGFLAGLLILLHGAPIGAAFSHLHERCADSPGGSAAVDEMGFGAGSGSPGRHGSVEHFVRVRGTLGARGWGWSRWRSFLKPRSLETSFRLVSQRFSFSAAPETQKPSVWKDTDALRGRETIQEDCGPAAGIKHHSRTRHTGL